MCTNLLLKKGACCWIAFVMDDRRIERELSKLAIVVSFFNFLYCHYFFFKLYRLNISS